MVMTVRQLRLALNVCPDDAEILIWSEDMGEEVPVKSVDQHGFTYHEKQKVVFLQMDEPLNEDWDEDEVEVGEASDEVGSPPWEYEPAPSPSPQRLLAGPRRTPPDVVEGEFTVLYPEERGDPKDTRERYGKAIP